MSLPSLKKEFLPEWKRFLQAKDKERVAQSMLLIGRDLAAISDFADMMIKVLLCHKNQGVESCDCKSCHLLLIKTHPDIEYINNEKPGDAIKIEQIRNLQQFAYTSPHIAKKRIVVLKPAEKMNKAAANALLKLLEEPPAHLMFILIAEEISFLPATIISRCQQWYFKSQVIMDKNYLALTEFYASDSDKGLLLNDCDEILGDLLLLKQKKTNGSLLAQKWSSHEFSSLIWLLYLINAELIMSLLKSSHEKKEIQALSVYFDSIHLFNQLDKLNQMNKKLIHNFNFNQTLALEHWLFSF